MSPPGDVQQPFTNGHQRGSMDSSVTMATKQAVPLMCGVPIEWMTKGFLVKNLNENNREFKCQFDQATIPSTPEEKP